MNRDIIARMAVGFVGFVAASCGAASPISPTIPTAAVAGKPSLPILLAGQSNALILRDLVWPDAINVVQGGTGIEAWAAQAPLGLELRADARRGPFAAFVWWQGEHDAAMTPSAYTAALRAIIADMRAAAGNISVRIVEINDTPSLMGIKSALRVVAADPGNRWISTSDLQPDPNAPAHLVASAYPVVAQRIYQSLVMP